MRIVPRPDTMDRAFVVAPHTSSRAHKRRKQPGAAQLRWRKERHRSLRIWSTAVWMPGAHGRPTFFEGAHNERGEVSGMRLTPAGHNGRAVDFGKAHQVFLLLGWHPSDRPLSAPQSSAHRRTMQRRGHTTSAHWPYAKRCSAPSIPVRQRASTTSPSGSRPWATLLGRGRYTSAHWRYAKKRSAPSTPARLIASPTSPSCSRPWATLLGRGRSTSAHWRYAKRRSAPSIQIPIVYAAINLASAARWRHPTEAVTLGERRPRRPRQGPWTGRLDQGQRLRHRRRSRRA